MKASRFDLESSSRELLRLFAESESPETGATLADRSSELKISATAAMEACDRSNEEERADHGALLLFLCAIADFEKHQRSSEAEERGRLVMHATRKLHSACLQYDRA